MRRNDKERFKKILQDKKAELRDRFEETDAALKASSGGHVGHVQTVVGQATVCTWPTWPPTRTTRNS